MDTMDVKHKKYFGPLLIEEWKIKNKNKFMKIWNDVNLYSETRGINRFKGFFAAFKKMKETGEEVGDIDMIENWINNTDELSNISLEKEIKKLEKTKKESKKGEQLKKLLNWSRNVNLGIKELEKTDRPFRGVKEALENISSVSDIVIVSSANREAIISEWSRHNILKYTDTVFSQEDGTKSDCLEKIRKYGYENKKILMIGDSPGDLEAAQKNNVLFYPIISGKEEEMWIELIKKAKDKFLKHEYRGEYQNELIDRFKRNLERK
ncbi:HAD family hydrolase [Leptotrichia sp. OH3620_COT-345]|uniref:HAD family hydrolase n=1 Tax=Leptotrichia sp. OH3620_COT-345 TaxID=2491048 RepID=UPI000F645777|nr:HAD hydrolase-like protein [Leptotrichia sp. OH3620_COT-345]RRD40179.1 HAD family hydrolase [Leptotrichia sp. OH3620_COT-345]